MKTTRPFMPAKTTLRIAAASLILLALFAGVAPASAKANPFANFTSIDFVANIETTGIAISGSNLPQIAELLYRKSGETEWRYGHPLMRVDNGQLIGSLFNLSASTMYEVLARGGTAEITGTFTTQPEAFYFTPARILRVDDNAAPGGDGSVAAPLNSIREAVKRATPGTQILVADGIYHETVTFTSSGTPGNWIQLKAEGSGAILDGSKDLSGKSWTYVKNNVWYTRIDAPTSYVARDQLRYYKYDDLQGLMDGVGHNRVPIQEGWYIAPNSTTLYVRSFDHPSRHTWQVPFLNDGVDTSGYDWLWVEGFEIRFYGAQYGGCGVCMKNASHVVIRNNKIHNLQIGVFIEWTGGTDRGNDARVEYNEIYDPPAGAWAWNAVKATSMEGTAVILRGHIGAIARGNNIHHFFNGVYTGSSGDPENTALAYDVDIYDNDIRYISDDAFEPEGACVNHRFRDNTVEAAYVGVSLAPVTQGPTWVLRSTFANYLSRGVKLDKNSDGIALLYHNTFWTNQKSPSAVDFIHAAYNVTMRNNIFQNNAYGIYAIPTGLTGNSFNNNDWYTTYSPRFKWENTDYKNVALLCARRGFECNGYEDFPGLAADLTLLPDSPNIDRGILLRGINDDYQGKAPDIGAREFGSGVPSANQPTPADTATPAPTPAATSTPLPTNTPLPTLTPQPTPQPVTETPIPPAVTTSITVIFNSIGTQDGWLLESGEGTNKGGAYDRGSTVLNLGDDDKDRQYRGVVSFLTDQLPDDARITSAQLILKKQGVVGTNPISTHNGLYAEIIAGAFSGNSELVYDDFSAPASPGSIYERFAVNDPSYSVEFGATNLAFINKGGLTQFRLFFARDDNDDMSADYLKVYSGNAAAGDQPQLSVTYALQSAAQPAPALALMAPPVNQPPVIASAGNFSLPENSTAVTTIAATDAQALSYAIIGGADAAYFTLDAFSGGLGFIAPPDYERPADFGADNVYNLIVQASDGELAATQELAIAITPVNDSAPVFMSAPGFEVAENSSAAAFIAAADADLPAQALTYAISGGADATWFNIHSVTGELNFTAMPDYEHPADFGADNIYNVVIQVSDGALSAAQEIAIAVTPVNDNAPLSASPAAVNVAENSTAVMFVAATDADLPAQALTYAISGGANSNLFNINASTGELNFISAPDYEIPADADNVYNVIVQITDGGLYATQEIFVTVTPINDNAPQIVSAGAFNVAENSSMAGLINAADADLPAQALTYAISGGADAAWFNINPVSGELSFIAPPDYEHPADFGADNIYNVVIQVSDGGFSVPQEITVAVTPVNDNAPAFITAPNLSVAENENAVLMLAATDADLPAQALTYAISGGADAAYFTLDASTGRLSFIAPPDYEAPVDAGADHIYNVVVKVSDGELSATQEVAIAVMPVNDNAPAFISVPDLNIAENESAALTLAATDADLPAQALTYTIIGDADAAYFTLDSFSGRLSFTAPPNYETPADFDLNNVYEITAQVSDGVFKTAQSIRVTVTDINEAP